MQARFETYNADGSLQISIDSRLLRTLVAALASTGTSDGSITVAGATQGTVVAAATNIPSDGTTPTVSSSGTTVSWSFGGAAAGERRSVDLNIMVY